MFGFVERYVHAHFFSATYQVVFLQFRRLGWSHHTPQTPCVERAVTFLRCLRRQPCSNHLLLRISKSHLFVASRPETDITF